MRWSPASTQHYPDVIRPALQIVRMREGLHTVAGCYAMITRKGDIYFLADCSVKIDPTAEELAEIALCAAEAARRFDGRTADCDALLFQLREYQTPAVREGSQSCGSAAQGDPTLVVDGEVMADVAVSPEMLEECILQLAQGWRQRADLPRPQFRQHRLQTAGQDRRRRKRLVPFSWG